MSERSGYPTIDPNIVGPPPERHAARVVAEMAQRLVGERSRLTDEIMSAILQSKTRCGSPVAQRRFADRLRRAGRRALLDLRIRPGKRANFVLSIVEWYVHDPIRGDVVSPRDPLPEKPWLECLATVLPVKHREKTFSAVLFLLSHHAMQRLAERCGARTPFDLLDAMRELWRAVEQAVDWDKAITRVLEGEQDIPIVRLKFVPVAGGKAVFEWDARDKSRLVVTTILDDGMAA